MIIERAFVRIPAGLVHYRSADAAPAQGLPPLYMAHAGPGCSRGLEPLIAALGQERRVIAPDTLGNGDSAPPPMPAPTIADYAESVAQILDALGVDQVDFYGDHTGAQIGAELAAVHPGRVRRLILDGVPLFPPDLKADLLARYAPPVQPDEYGGHLAWAWGFVRDLTLHFPYYLTDPAHRLNTSPIPPVEARQALVVDLLKALPTYHLAYRAAFAHDTAARLSQLRVPTLLLGAPTDPLVAYLEAAAALVPGARHLRLDREAKAAAITAFLEP
jgi:pimeloyl-ACP methyl ester carboxylesterase